MKKRILFVDDEPNVLNGLRRMLDSQYEVWDMKFVTSADQALEEMKRAEVDVVVSDVRMPGKDGFELLKILQDSERTKDIPVIIVTGNYESSLKRRALNLGATDLLNKPVDFEDLVARVQSVLRLKSYQDELKAQNEILEQKVEARTIQLETAAAKLEESRLDVIWRLGKAGEYRDEQTGNHVVRVGCYCQPIAQALGMGGNFAETLLLASPLHDIGKIGIPDHILLKPGKLSAAEWVVMKQHCAIGAAILRQNSKAMQVLLQSRLTRAPSAHEEDGNSILKMASSIAMSHHEKWNGTGYPNGLIGEGIPLEARIVTLADVYDALSSDRPYRPAFSENEVLKMIREDVGQHFDPAVHRAFEKSIEEIQLIRSQFSDEEFRLPGKDALKVYESRILTNDAANVLQGAEQ